MFIQRDVFIFKTISRKVIPGATPSIDIFYHFSNITSLYWNINHFALSRNLSTMELIHFIVKQAIFYSLYLQLLAIT